MTDRVRAYYNEVDLYCCGWLQNLMDAGHITPGRVDDRSIADVRPDDLRAFDRCHFFAGIGGWEYALRFAGWGDDRPVWTGSCPCQPFSGAGKGKAGDDGRHLWPAWFSLIRECKPAVVFGEQVEAAIGWGWLDLVFSDLEAEGYACGTAVLPACSVGAPHIRQRLWFVAESDQQRCQGEGVYLQSGGSRQAISSANGTGEVGFVADADAARCGEGRPGETGNDGAAWEQSAGLRADGLVADSIKLGLSRGDRPQMERIRNAIERPSITDSELADADSRRQQQFYPGQWEVSIADKDRPWSDLLWLPCTDGKARPTQSGLFPLAHGISGRVGRLRAYGNAIVPQVAAEFIQAHRQMRTNFT
jgi:DNA (cytosine-5)-methyltransferase 1